MTIENKYYTNSINRVVKTVPFTTGFGKTGLDFLEYNFVSKSWERRNKIDLSEFRAIQKPF